MSSSITLSAATRQNLLSLQDTASLLSTTQNRLSTGKKVNSALDNPVNFFTSQALNDRSGALSSLLDGVSNGIQTIQAANTGLTQLQSLTSQLTSTAQQALASANSFTAKASLSTTAQNGVTANNLLGGGASVQTGTKLVPASKSTGSDATTVATTNSSNAAGVLGLTDGAQFSVTTGGATSTITLSANDTIATFAAKVSTATNGVVTATYSDTTNQFTFAGSTNTTSFSVANVGTSTTLSNLGITAGTYAATTGPAAAGTTTGTAVGIAAGAGTTATPSATAAQLGLGATSQFTINGKNVQVSGTDTLTQIAAKIGAATGGDPTTGAGGDVTATASGGHLVLQAKDGSTAITVGGTSAVTTALGLNAATVGAGNGTISAGSLASDVGFAAGDTFSVNGAIVTVGSGDSLNTLATKINTATAGKVTASFDGSAFKLTATDNNTSINVSDGTGSGKVSKLGFTSGSTLAAGSGLGALSGQTLNITTSNPNNTKEVPKSTTISFGTGAGQVSTLDQLNAQLASANAQATVDATGKLTINTANQAGGDSLTISGTATGAGTAFGTTLSAAPTIGGDGATSRDNLVTTFNNLLTQIDQSALDSGYNGVNLLAGDDLKINFNDTNTSGLQVKGSAVSSQSLGLSAIGSVDFRDSNAINAVIGKVQSATATLKSQASTLGSNLAVVQNRQTFTKSMINVLDTGSANLVNADMNEEAANSQALSTRNSLGISALSLANQAQQGVLQLLR